MTRLTLDEAQEQLSSILDKGARGETFVIEGDGAQYHINVIATKTQQSTKRVAGLGRGSIIHMSDDFTDEDPEINKMFYGD